MSDIKHKRKFLWFCEIKNKWQNPYDCRTITLRFDSGKAFSTNDLLFLKGKVLTHFIAKSKIKIVLFYPFFSNYFFSHAPSWVQILKNYHSTPTRYDRISYSTVTNEHTKNAGPMCLLLVIV